MSGFGTEHPQHIVRLIRMFGSAWFSKLQLKVSSVPPVKAAEKSGLNF